MFAFIEGWPRDSFLCYQHTFPFLKLASRQLFGFYNFFPSFLPSFVVLLLLLLSITSILSCIPYLSKVFYITAHHTTQYHQFHKSLPFWFTQIADEPVQKLKHQAWLTASSSRRSISCHYRFSLHRFYTRKPGSIMESLSDGLRSIAILTQSLLECLDPFPTCIWPPSMQLPVFHAIIPIIPCLLVVLCYPWVWYSWIPLR